MSLVFILVSSSCTTKDEDYIKFKCKDNFISLDKTEYQIIKHKKYIELKILAKPKLDLLKEVMECSMILSLNKKKYTIKASNFKESKLPEDCDYFFSEYNNGCIIFQEEVIFLKSINI